MIFLTPQQALEVMIEFLESNYFKKDADSYISQVLSEISPSIIWENNTGDPAAWPNWLKAIEFVSKYSKEPKSDDKITLKTAFLAMREFLYSVYGRFDDVIVVLYDTRLDADDNLVNKEIWNNYLQAVDAVLIKIN